MKVRDVLDRVTTIYHDIEYRRCTPKQYLQFLDDAIMEVINYVPASHEKRVVVQLKPGARQQLPDDGYTLIDIYANQQYIKELDTYYDGKPVYQVARKDLDYFSNWYSKVEKLPYIDEFAYDIRTPQDYWVNPPVSHLADVRVEIGYSYQHPTFGDIDLDTVPFSSVQDMSIDVLPQYRISLVNYMLYKLFSTDTTADRDIQIAAQYLQLFYNSIDKDSKSSLTSTTRIVEPTTEGIGLYNDTPSTVQSVKQ